MRVYVLPDTVDVAGERRDETASSLTATELRLDRTEIDAFLPATVADALISVPGVDVVKTGAWSARPAIRGMSGDRVLVMVDGVRMNQLRGHGAEPSIVPMSELEAVEVAPGSRSSSYGSSAIGGVVNLVTTRPMFSETPRIDFTLGSRLSGPGTAWSQDGRARIAGEHLAAEISGGVGGLDEIESASAPIPNSGYDEEHYALRGAAVGRGMHFEARHSRSDATNVGLPAFNSSGGGNAYYPLKRNDSSRLQLDVPDLGSFADASLLVDRQLFLNHFTETTVDSAYVHGNFAGTVTTETADRVEQTSRGAQASLAGGSLWKARVHGELREEEVSGPRDTGITTRSPSDSTLAEIDRTGESVPPGTRTLYAGSAHVSRDFESVMVEMGTRWDSYHTDADSSTSLGTPDADKTESQWSFDGGVAVPIHAVELYTHAGTGFRVPNLDERYYNGFIHGALYLFGNPDLLPEESFSYEVGVRKASRWANRTLADFRLSAYRSDVENLITFEYVTQLYLIPRFQYRNVHRARLEGIEGSVRLVRGTADLRVDAGFPRGIDRDTDEELNDVGAPRVLVEAGSGMGWRDLRGAVRWRWSGEQNGADPQLASPAFTTTDLQVSTSWSGARATFAVRNVFDEDYREPLSFIPESGRTFLLSLDVAFGFGLTSRP